MDAFDRLLEEHGAGLQLYARKWAPDRQTAVDIVQEALVNCWRRDPGLTNTRLPYLYVAVRHAALNQHRADNRRQQREQAVVSSNDYHFTCPFAEGERREQIAKILETLPDTQREAVVLHLWCGLSFSEIGEVANCSANTAASRYRYALATLREQLAGQECHL